MWRLTNADWPRETHIQIQSDFIKYILNNLRRTEKKHFKCWMKCWIKLDAAVLSISNYSVLECCSIMTGMVVLGDFFGWPPPSQRRDHPTPLISIFNLQTHNYSSTAQPEAAAVSSVGDLLNLKPQRLYRPAETCWH